MGYTLLGGVVGLAAIIITRPAEPRDYWRTALVTAAMLVPAFMLARWAGLR